MILWNCCGVEISSPCECEPQENFNEIEMARLRDQEYITLECSGCGELNHILNVVTQPLVCVECEKALGGEYDKYVTSHIFTPKKDDEIANPNHYKGLFGLKVIEVIKNFLFHNFYLANVIKYVLRCEKKGQKRKDLNKAKEYIDLELARMDEEESLDE